MSTETHNSSVWYFLDLCWLLFVSNKENCTHIFTSSFVFFLQFLTFFFPLFPQLSFARRGLGLGLGPVHGRGAQSLHPVLGERRQRPAPRTHSTAVQTLQSRRASAHRAHPQRHQRYTGAPCDFILTAESQSIATQAIGSSCQNTWL